MEEVILERLEEKGGPKARQLFERFIRDVEKLQAEQEQKVASCCRSCRVALRDLANGGCRA